MLEPLNLEARANTQVILSIELSNEDEVKLCQFDLRLPDGVTVATKSNGKLDAKLTERAESHSVSATRLGNGDYRFVVSSMEGDSFTGNSGALMEITLDVAATMEAGQYAVKVLNTELSVPDGNDLIVVRPADTEATLTVKRYTPGDVNSDGSVSVTDVGIIINLILSDGAATRALSWGATEDDFLPGLSLTAIADDYRMELEQKERFIGFQFDVKLAERTGWHGACPTLAGTVTNNEFNTQDNQKLILNDVSFTVTITMPELPKCSTPTIAYDHGELVLACETEDVTFVSEVTTSSTKGCEGERVSLAPPTYTITVVAKKEGYADSDAATATIQWGNGRPVFTGFSSVTIDTAGYSDVNGDGTVDVADIASVISEMAARARKHAEAEE